MGATNQPAILGQVCSLHIHPEQPGAPMQPVTELRAVAGQGLEQDVRYYGRLSRSTGQASRRQVSLIAREQIALHAATLGLDQIAPGAVRANIETEGLDLGALVGQQVQVGEAVLFIYEARTPCAKMDAVCHGLRAQMEGKRQGVLAEVVRSGRITPGDAVRRVG